MKIYICSALRLKEVNNNITSILEELGYEVYNPCRDTNQAVFFKDNTTGIKSADYIIAVLDYTGRDFCFEIGYAKALGKIIIPFSTQPVELEQRSMMTDTLSNQMNLTKLINYFRNLL